MNKMKKLLDGYSPKRVLDVCTGMGSFIERMKDSFSGTQIYTGIDSLEKVIEIARKNNKDPRVSYQVMDCEDLGFKDNSFNMVSFSNSIHHLEDPSKTFNEIKRVVDENGYILICEMYKDGQTPKQMSHVLFHHWSAKIGRIMGKVHNPTYNRGEILDILSENELEVVKDLDILFPFDEDDSTKLLCDQVDKILSDVNDQIKNHREYNRILEESQELKSHIMKHGFQHATSYVALCKVK